MTPPPPATNPTLEAIPAATVYVVEDDDAVRTSLELLLRVRGYLSDSFASGEAFLEAGRWRRPACVIVDVRLPGIDGLELARRLRQAEAPIPVIVVTAHGDVSTARTALREGAVDFLEKPVDDDELFNAVEQALASDQRRFSLEIERRAHLQRLQKLTAREREVFDRIEEAFLREKQIQGWSRKKKGALIAGERNQLHHLAQCQNETHYAGFDSAQPSAGPDPGP